MINKLFIIAILLICVIFTSILLVSCTPKYSIKKYPPAKTAFKNAIVDNLNLMAQYKDILENSDRGFRGEVYYTLGTQKAYPGGNQNYLECVEEQLSLYEEDSIHILQCYIYLTEYRKKDLDENAIKSLKEYF